MLHNRVKAVALIAAACLVVLGGCGRWQIFDADTPTHPAMRKPVASPETQPDSLADMDTWTAAAWGRYFRMSYASEMEIEPPIRVAEERDELQKILDKIAQASQVARDQHGTETKNVAGLMEVAAMLDQQRVSGRWSPQVAAILDFLAGNVYFDLDQFNAAAAAYRTATDKHPKFRRAWQNMGYALSRRDAHREALEAFTRVLELGGGDRYVYGSIGMANLRLENYLAAESAFRMPSLWTRPQRTGNAVLSEAFRANGDIRR